MALISCSECGKKISSKAETCPNCGKTLKEGASFCTDCGAAVGASAGAAAAAAAPGAGTAAGPQEATQPLTAGPETASPVPPGAAAAGEGAPAPGYVPGPPPRKNKGILIVGVLGGILVLAAIVVLVLWLTMWRDGAAGGTGDPIELAEKYITAMEQGDIDSYLDCFEGDVFASDPLLEEMGMDMKELLEMSFEMMEISFEGYALELEYERGDEARVVTTEGTVVMSVMGFDQEFDLAEDPMEFEMIKEGGRWYLTRDPMPGSMSGDVDLGDMDFEDFEDFEDMNLEDLNLEDMEQYLPEDLSLEDLENMDVEELNQLLEDLEKMLEDMPMDESST